MFLATSFHAGAAAAIGLGAPSLLALLGRGLLLLPRFDQSFAASDLVQVLAEYEGCRFTVV
jgi:hypothetical protein